MTASSAVRPRISPMVTSTCRVGRNSPRHSDKHFSGVEGLMLAAVDLSRLGETVRWEPARGGQLFPHIDGPLPIGAVVSVAPVERER